MFQWIIASSQFKGQETLNNGNPSQKLILKGIKFYHFREGTLAGIKGISSQPRDIQAQADLSCM